MLENVFVCARVCVCLVRTSFRQPLGFTFFFASTGQTKCEILPSAKLSKGPGGCMGRGGLPSVPSWTDFKRVLAKLQYWDAKELAATSVHP